MPTPSLTFPLAAATFPVLQAMAVADHIAQGSDRVLDLACKCGGNKKCPQIEATSAGFTVSEPETGAEVRFTPEQMMLAVEWLRRQLASRAGG